jgi:hypothetical protein
LQSVASVSALSTLNKQYWYQSLTGFKTSEQHAAHGYAELSSSIQVLKILCTEMPCRTLREKFANVSVDLL